MRLPAITLRVPKSHSGVRLRVLRTVVPTAIAIALYFRAHHLAFPQSKEKQVVQLFKFLHLTNLPFCAPLLLLPVGREVDCIDKTPTSKLRHPQTPWGIAEDAIQEIVRACAITLRAAASLSTSVNDSSSQCSKSSGPMQLSRGKMLQFSSIQSLENIYRNYFSLDDLALYAE